MAAGGAHCGLGVVAGAADVLPGVPDRLGASDYQVLGPVVSELPETFRDDGPTHHEKEGQAEKEHYGWPDQMGRIAKGRPHMTSFGGAVGILSARMGFPCVFNGVGGKFNGPPCESTPRPGGNHDNRV